MRLRSLGAVLAATAALLALPATHPSATAAETPLSQGKSRGVAHELEVLGVAEDHPHRYVVVEQHGRHGA
ncbi:hypothetical protein ACWDE9_44595, partial [Streptomyces olivaceoviridis]